MALKDLLDRPDIPADAKEEIRQELLNFQTEKLKQFAIYKSGFDGAINGEAIADGDTGILLDCNEALTRMVNRTKDELIGQPQTILHPQQVGDSSFKRHLVIGGEIIETQIITKDGIVRDVEIRANTLELNGQKLIHGEFLDITDRKRAEETLNNSKLFLSMLLETISVPIFYKDLEGRYTGFNKAFEIFFGKSREQLIGKSVFDINPPELAKIYHAEDIKLFEKPSSQVYDSQVRDAQGVLRDVVFHKASLINAQGSVIGLIGAILDITERKRAEEVLHESEERFRSAFLHSPIGMALVSLDGKWVMGNTSLCSIVGYSEAELMTKTLQDITHPADQNADMEYVHQMLDGKIANYTMEKRYYHKDGHIVWVLLAVTLVKNSTGTPLYFISQIEDITKRKQTGKDLLESKTLVDSIVENVPLMIFLKEAQDLRFVVFNRAGEELLGYNRKDLLGKNDFDFFPPEQATYFVKKDREVLNGEKDILDIPEEVIKTAKKGIRILHTRKVCIRGADGVTKYLLGISEDITEAKEMERILIEGKQKAEELNTMKDQLLHNTSHEMRTPLNGIMGFAEIISGSEEAPEEIRGYARKIYNSGNHLLGIIKDILALAKIGSGNDKVTKNPINLYNILHVVGDLLTVDIQNNQVEFAIDYSARLPKEFVADGEKIQQIITNLVSNAVKFSHKGQVKIRVDCGETIGSSVDCLIHVSDTGFGIQKEKLHLLFKRFSQVDGSSTRKYGGTGLGLAISQSLAQLMDGEITVASEYGEGTTFTLRLPLTINHEKRIISGKKVIKTCNAKVLIVDDDPTATELCAVILGIIGCKTDIAKNGKIALDMLDKNNYDVILMDCHMPEMDGFEATKAIRGKEKQTQKHVPIIALTAAAFEEDGIKCSEIGMDDYISKPMKMADLENKIIKWTKHPSN